MARPTHDLAIGDQVPDFCLDVARRTADGVEKERFCLREQRGAPVLVVFYPAAFTPI